jgi:hypothetical protein
MKKTPFKPVPAAPPPKKKHWVRRILITLVVLVAALALAVQIVLATDLPRGIVVAQLEKQLGLHLTVKSLKTTWLGKTELHNVTIGLPLADKAFLDVPVMRVRNTTLFGLMLGRPVAVKSIELDRPHLYVLQGSDGTWNLQELAALLGRTGGQKPGEESAQTSATPAMPDVRINDGVVSVIDNKNRTAEIQPLSVRGYRESGVAWKYDVDVPSRVNIAGQLVPGGNWEHVVAVKVQDIGAWARPWSADFPNLGVDATWRGAMTAGGVGGRMEVRKLTIAPADQTTAGPATTPTTRPAAGTTAIMGAFVVEAGGGKVTLRPDNLLLNAGSGPASQLRLASGAISFNSASKDLTVSNLIVALFGGTTKIAADYNLNASTGKIDVAWEKLALPGNTSSGGTFTATVVKPFPDRFKVAARFNSKGTQGVANWMAGIGFDLTGKSFSDFDWNLHVDKLLWQRRNLGIQLDGLALSGGLHDNALVLGSIGMGNRDLIAGSAVYRFSGARPWEVHLRGQHWPLHALQTEVAFDLNARGDNQGIYVEKTVVKTPDAELGIKSSFVFHQPKPLNVELAITNAAPAQPPAALAANNQSKLLNGSVNGHFFLNGTVAPLQLEASGQLNGRELAVRNYHFGDIHIVLSPQSHLDSDGLVVFADCLSLFGGKCSLSGAYDLDTADVTVKVGFDKISLAKVAAIAGGDHFTGTASGSIIAILPWFTPDLDHLNVPPATITVDRVDAHGFEIDQIRTTVSLRQGTLAVNPILTRGKGSADIETQINLHNLRHIDVAANIQAWPIDMAGAAAHVDLSVKMPRSGIDLPNPKSLDLAQRKLRVQAPEITVNATTTLKGDRLGELVAHAGAYGRELDVRGVHMRLLDGRLDGQAHGHLDHLLDSTAEFTWEKLDLKKVALIFPQIKEMSGELTGDLRIAPTTVARPREKLALLLTNDLKNGGWRTLPIRDLRIAAYFGEHTERGETEWRVVLDDSPGEPNFIHLADGTIELWGRFGIHARETSSQYQFRLRDLDLDKIVHAIEPSAARMPGKVGGTVMLLRAPTPAPRTSSHAGDQTFPPRPVRLVSAPSPEVPPLKQLLDPIYGEGTIELTKANLANFPPFAFLYNIANLFNNVKGNEGNGNVDFRIERGTLSVDHMRYFNRGTEILAVATVEDLWKAPDSRVNATASLTARPLSTAKLPIFTDIDTAITSIQAGLQLTSVRVTGTLHKYGMQQLSLSELGRDMRNFLVGDANGK